MQSKTALFVSSQSLWKRSTKQSLWFLHQHFEMPDWTEEIWDTDFYLHANRHGCALQVCKPSLQLCPSLCKNCSLHFQQCIVFSFKDSMNIRCGFIIYRLLSACNKESSSFKCISNSFQTTEGEGKKISEETYFFCSHRFQWFLQRRKEEYLLI